MEDMDAVGTQAQPIMKTGEPWSTVVDPIPMTGTTAGLRNGYENYFIGLKIEKNKKRIYPRESNINIFIKI